MLKKDAGADLAQMSNDIMDLVLSTNSCSATHRHSATIAARVRKRELTLSCISPAAGAASGQTVPIAMKVG